MDFSFTDEQEAVRSLSAQIFEGLATVERVKAVEHSTDRFDRELWSELAKANLLGIALPEEFGGSGLGIIELCLLLEQQGRRVAPVPLLATLAMAALPIAEFGTAEQRRAWLPGVVSGQTVLTAALSEDGDNDPRRPSTVATPRGGGGWTLAGHKPSVPAAHLADRILVPARTAGGSIVVFLVDPARRGVRIETATTTNRELHAHLTFDEVQLDAGDVLGGATDGGPTDGGAILRWIVDRAMVAVCAVQLGVAEEAVRQAADYTSARVQFGKALSTFQGVALKAADAYIDTEAMRATLWQAAWRLSEGRDATPQVEVAKWWAAEGGQRVVHITQHLHGGIGADVEYPIHRYFLWGKQLEVTLGGASAQLARLGTLIADAARRGEPVGAAR